MKQTPPTTFADYADLADRCGAGALAALLRECRPGLPVPPVPTTDLRPALDLLGRRIEQATEQRFHYDPSFKTWAYGPRWRRAMGCGNDS